MSGLGVRRRLRPAEQLARTRIRAARRWLIRARLDRRDVRNGDRDPLLPPRRKGLPSQIAAIGEKLVGAMIDPGGLHPDGAVLDLGCGPGRTAAPLTRYLDPAAGSYEGFDVMPESIRWCRRAISSKHPNFNFQLADLHNGQYNPGGRQSASEYTFPYPDASFDIAVAGSLFSHLRPFEAQRYLDETARVLKLGGRLIATWYLLNEEAEDLLERGMAKRPGLFAETKPPLKLDYALTDERGARFRAPEAKVPEHLIAVYEEDVRAQHERAGLQIVELRLGSWPGRQAGPDSLGQDMIVAERGPGT